MSYGGPLVEGVLLGRRKRFFADVRLADGAEIVAHCANTGSMRGLLGPEVPVRVLRHDDPGRRLAWSLEQLRVGDAWVMVNTARANRIVEAAVLAGRVPELAGYAELRRERPYGARSRIDLELRGRAEGLPALRRGPSGLEPVCLVEVKSATLVEGRVARFPDAVTARGTRHVEELTEVAAGGGRAVLFVHVARDDVDRFEPAADLDPAYARALREGAARGVEVIAWTCRPTDAGAALARPVPVAL